MIYNLSNTDELALFNSKVSLLKSKRATVELNEKKGTRTLQQNKAIHLYCGMIADTLNDLGWTFNYKGIKGQELEMKYTQILVKETIWKPILQALFDKKSTTELTTKEVSEVAEHIEHFFATRQGLDLPFPSIEHFINEDRKNEYQRA